MLEVPSPEAPSALIARPTRTTTRAPIGLCQRNAIGSVKATVSTTAIPAMSPQNAPAARYSEFESRLRKLHPYDVPEIVGLNVAEGNPDYLRWIGESCSRN